MQKITSITVANEIFKPHLNSRFLTITVGKEYSTSSLEIIVILRCISVFFFSKAESDLFSHI